MADQLSRMVAVLPQTGMALDDLSAWIKSLESEFGADLVLRSARLGQLAVFTPGFTCDCRTCQSLLAEDERRLMPETTSFLTGMQFMILCPDCGNKRCPKATWHENDCTNSNDVGQVGSVYGIMPNSEDEDR